MQGDANFNPGVKIPKEHGITWNDLGGASASLFDVSVMIQERFIEFPEPFIKSPELLYPRAILKTLRIIHKQFRTIPKHFRTIP